MSTRKPMNYFHSPRYPLSHFFFFKQEQQNRSENTLNRSMLECLIKKCFLFHAQCYASIDDRLCIRKKSLRSIEMNLYIFIQLLSLHISFHLHESKCALKCATEKSIRFKTFFNNDSNVSCEN